eukprot:6211759-Amphidinium_carterae.1
MKQNLGGRHWDRGGRRRPDGRTACERRHGRQCRRELVEFTEKDLKVLYLPDGDKPSRLEHLV